MSDAAQIITANGIENADAIVRAAEVAGLALNIAVALAEKESGGKNVYGHDAGGAMYGAGQVTEQNFKNQFLPAVLGGAISNGVGPVQITYPGYFKQEPSYPWWDPYFNCLKGFQILAASLKSESISAAGSRYNSGSPTGAPAYGSDLAAKAAKWSQILAQASAPAVVKTEPTEVQRALVQWMRDHIGKYYYTQDMAKRADPDGSGGTDCSALIRYCYQQVCGIEVGTWTGDQQHYGTLVFGPEADYATAVAKLQLGDRIYFAWTAADVDSFSHVEMYMGDEQTCGHGGDPNYGPVMKSFRQQWDWAHTIIARRDVESGTVVKQPVVDDTPAVPDSGFEHIDFPDYPLRGGEWFGDIAGPAASHGGYYEWERPFIRAIQNWLVVHGYAGNVDRADWCDGLFEGPTVEAVARFQQAEMPGTKFYGQVWDDDYAQMVRNNK